MPTGSWVDCTVWTSAGSRFPGQGGGGHCAGSCPPPTPSPPWDCAAPLSPRAAWRTRVRRPWEGSDPTGWRRGQGHPSPCSQALGCCCIPASCPGSSDPGDEQRRPRPRRVSLGPGVRSLGQDGCDLSGLLAAPRQVPSCWAPSLPAEGASSRSGQGLAEQEALNWSCARQEAEAGGPPHRLRGAVRVHPHLCPALLKMTDTGKRQ